MSSRKTNPQGGRGYRAPYLTPSQLRFQKLQGAARAAFGDSIEFSKKLYLLLVDTQCTDEQEQYSFPFSKRKEAANKLVLERVKLARDAIADRTTGVPLVSPASFHLFEDEICKLNQLYEKLHSKDGKAAAAIELEAYKKKLIAERIVVGTDGWRQRIAEREAALAKAGKQLILPKLLSDPNAVPPEAQPNKDYSFRPAGQDHAGPHQTYKSRSHREMVTA